MKGGLVKAAERKRCQKRLRIGSRETWEAIMNYRRRKKIRLTLGGVLECRMQVVDNLGEDIARPLIAILI